MNDKVTFTIGKYKKACARLKEGCIESIDILDKDGVIKRFEFTFEALWKALKIILEEQGIKVSSPRSAFKESFKLSFIDNEEIFLNMLEDRNRTTHLYDEKTSDEIFERIKESYLPAFEKILSKI